MSDARDFPEDVPLALYALATRWIPSPIRRACGAFFFSISPDVPYNLGPRLKKKSYYKVIVYGILMGLTCCLFTTAAFCYFDQVLYPGQCEPTESEQCSNVLFFSQDTVNIIMYAIVTPLTVGFGLALLLATLATWRTLDATLERERSTLLGWKGFLIIILIVTASAVFIARYVQDAVVAGGLHFWFLGDPGSGDVLRPITVYYAILNFIILVFTLSCVALFVTAVRPMIVLSSILSRQKISLQEFDEDELIEKLAPFADVYLFAKILLAITMAHSIVWSYSPLALTANFDLERLAIVVVSIFFIAIPRLHFELEWYRAAVKFNQKGARISLRPKFVRGLSFYAIWVADFLIIGGYLLSVIGIFEFGQYAS